MYLSNRKSPTTNFFRIGGALVLLGGLLAALSSFYKPMAGILVSTFMGLSLSYLAIQLPGRRSQLMAIIVLAVLSGLFPAIILWTICFFFSKRNNLSDELDSGANVWFFRFSDYFYVLFLGIHSFL